MAEPAQIPILSTDRLRMEPFHARHSRGMFELWSSPEVCLHSGPASDIRGNSIRLPALDRSDSDKILAFFIEREHRGTGFRWALLLLDDRTFVGAMGFNSIGSCCEIAYHQRPDFWGNGYMFEACEAAIDWAFTEVGASTIEAFVDPANNASSRLAERLGFSITGEVEDGAHRYLLRAVAV